MKGLQTEVCAEARAELGTPTHPGRSLPSQGLKETGEVTCLQPSPLATERVHSSHSQDCREGGNRY